MSDKVVRHRFFWSLFIQRTEKWLGSMSLSGLHLCGLEPHSSFIFKSGEPNNSKYCFSYTKFENPNDIRSAKVFGWKNVAKLEKWRVYESENRDIKSMPNRRGLYLRNNSLLCLYAFISSIALLMLFGICFGFFLIYSNQASSNDGSFRRSVVIIGIFALLLLCNFMLFLFMTSANSKILENPGDAIAPEIAYHQFLSRKTFENWLEKLLIKDGDIMKRLKPLWLTTPRSLEKWLSKMERRGFNVYKINKSGMIFYFIKSVPRNIKYCVVSNEGGNIARFISEGWQVVFSTSNRLDKFGRIVIVSRIVEDFTERPFSNEKDYVVNALHITMNYVLFYFVFLMLAVTSLFVFTYCEAGKTAIIITSAISVLMTALIVRALLYLANSMIIAKRGFVKISKR
ncbi:MAG TPA: DUF2812 domain-containing protein [Ruminiclostridium sp.]|nr:DUF2812 domain-containing protein [Ruminiclostridium sp.]